MRNKFTFMDIRFIYVSFIFSVFSSFSVFATEGIPAIQKPTNPTVLPEVNALFGTLSPDLYVNIFRRYKRMMKYYKAGRKEGALREAVRIKWLYERYSGEELNVRKCIEKFQKHLKKKRKIVLSKARIDKFVKDFRMFELRERYSSRCILSGEEDSDRAFLKAHMAENPDDKFFIKSWHGCSRNVDYALVTGAIGTGLMFIPIPGCQTLGYSMWIMAGTLLSQEAYNNTADHLGF
jgi:hypothetical protein